MDLSVLCILAFEWVLHGNRYALNNRKDFYWLWNRSYISFPLISPPNFRTLYASRVAYVYWANGVFFSFFAFLLLPWMIADFFYSLLSAFIIWPAARVNIQRTHIFVCVCVLCDAIETTKQNRSHAHFFPPTMQKSQKPNNFSPLRNIA